MADIAIIGAGPAGLIAADHLSGRGHAVSIYERMPSPGRKFLLAGRGGLNLTHTEPVEQFLGRYAEAESAISPAIRAFSPGDLRQWSDGLGEETFVGSSGRVFPKSFKASPLLRAWLRRLSNQGVTLNTGHRWTGWGADGRLAFSTPQGTADIRADAALLALGGASWPRLGSDGSWVKTLTDRGVAVASLRPANCGFAVPWSRVLTDRFAGAPLKRIAITLADKTAQGEAMITEEGIEGGAIYALAGPIREAVAREGSATITLDLRPDLGVQALTDRLAVARKGESFSNRLRKQLVLPPVAISLIHESDRSASQREAASLAGLVKALPLTITAVRPIDRAISTAGGVRFEALTEQLMLKAMPGVFCAGEMLDWEAPTGGYLLQGCFATGMTAARGVDHFVSAR
jgi:uncharacterized flavoprotein (TIGR03862 family)